MAKFTTWICVLGIKCQCFGRVRCHRNDLQTTPSCGPVCARSRESALPCFVQIRCFQWIYRVRLCLLEGTATPFPVLCQLLCVETHHEPTTFGLVRNRIFRTHPVEVVIRCHSSLDSEPLENAGQYNCTAVWANESTVLVTDNKGNLKVIDL